MNKKGITLIELLAVLVVMGLLATIVFVSVGGILGTSKDNTNSVQNKSIKEAAKMYLADNIDTIDFENETSVDITLSTLVQNGYLTGTLKDNKSGKEYDLYESTVTITKDGNSYTYTLDLITE